MSDDNQGEQTPYKPPFPRRGIQREFENPIQMDPTRMNPFGRGSSVERMDRGLFSYLADWEDDSRNERMADVIRRQQEEHAKEQRRVNRDRNRAQSRLNKEACRQRRK